MDENGRNKLWAAFREKRTPQIREQFNHCNVYTKDKCKDCFCKFFCSGGCSANAYNFNGDINEPYDIACKLEQKRVECAIMIKCALAE